MTATESGVLLLRSPRSPSESATRVSLKMSLQSAVSDTRDFSWPDQTTLRSGDVLEEMTLD